MSRTLQHSPNRSALHLLLHLFRGFLVGFAGLLPGLCGSTLLVLFGMYRPLTAALAHPFTGFRRHLMLYGPFFAAAGIGVLVGSRVLASFFARYETEMLYLFIGFMGGALPDLFRHAHRTRGHPAGWLAFLALFCACLAAATLNLPGSSSQTTAPLSWPVWVLAGAGVGLGSILPGASVAFLLIYFGVYQEMLEGVASLNPAVLLPVGLGAGLTILLFAQAADWLFRVAEGTATRGILGLVTGSIVLIFPGWPGGLHGILCLLLILAGFVASATLNKLAPPSGTGRT